MATTAISVSEPATETMETLADLVHRLGDIPLERIRLQPPPGTAREEDVLMRPGGEKRLFELVDGTLVEKPMGFYEARLAAVIIYILEGFLSEHDFGIVLGADATMRLAPGLVRVPDVSFFSWDRFPDRKLPSKPIPDLAPDLAVEVLSKTNTKREMNRKLREFFAAGVKLVWYLDPQKRSATAYPAVDQSVILDEDGVLEGGNVLPGFRLRVRDWFERAGAVQEE